MYLDDTLTEDELREAATEQKIIRTGNNMGMTKSDLRDNWVIAKLMGYRGQMIAVEDWRQARDYLQPVVRVFGPREGEKYRFSATKADLIAFARDILEWAGEDVPALSPEEQDAAGERSWRSRSGDQSDGFRADND
jgi:hypothetical protein